MSAELLHQVNAYEQAKNGLHNPCSQRKGFVVRRTRGARWCGAQWTQRLPVEHRNDCAPMRDLAMQAGDSSQTSGSPGTSWSHVVDIIGGRR